MSAVPVEFEATRRRLTPRQAAVVDRLIAAAAEEAREQGYDGMTVRSVARRAGVAAATAYTHFASKDHLLAEVMWRRMAELLSAPPAIGKSPLARVTGELELLGTFMAGDPGLAAAGTTALLGPGAEVRELRTQIGTAAHDRLAAAAGDSVDPAVVRSLDLMYSGALLWMGMGHLPSDRVPAALTDSARLLLGGGA